MQKEEFLEFFKNSIKTLASCTTSKNEKERLHEELIDLGYVFNSIIDDTELIIKSFKEKDFSNRIDVSKYDGIFALLADKLNETLEIYQAENWINESSKTLYSLALYIKNSEDKIKATFDKICKDLRFKAGSIYLLNNSEDRLRLFYEYGELQHNNERRVEYNLGEGVIGQTAVKKEPYIIEAPKKILIKSSLVAFEPKAVYVYPIIFANKLLGVVEFAGFNHLNSFQMDYLQNAIEVLSSFIYSNILNKKIDRVSQISKKILDSQTNFTILTNEKEIKVVNRSFLEFFGYEDLDSFKKDHKCICDFFEEEEEEEEEFLKAKYDDESWLRHVLNNIEKSFKVKIKDKNGNVHIFQVVASGKKIEEEEEEEEEERYVVIFNDITEIYEAIEREKRAREAKDIFLANMSHDIRTPLNGIISTLAILQKSELNDKQKHLVDICRNSTTLLLSIVNDVLDLSKLQTGKFQLNPRNSNLEKVLVELGEIYEFQAKSKDLNFRLYIDEKLPECIVCDTDRLRQIFTNLLSNALKFTKEGEVIFEIRVLNKKDGKIKIRFAIIDTGIGIAKDKQKEIFEPFKQEDQTTATNFGGTGLGLSIVKELVELHNSKLELESNIGLGSEFAFEVEFDLCGKSLEEEEEEEEEEEVNFSNTHVLIAEDNETNQMVIEMLLEDFGIEKITITNDGLECVQEYIKRHKEFDLIFMDINMPKMDGVDATKKILEFEKLDGGLEHTPIVALTANSMAGDREKYLKNGFDEYLAKPIEEYKLLKILKKFL